MQYIIGIDEAGRGPLAGPVAVGVAKVAIDFDWGLVPGVTDSKQLSEVKREEIFAAAKTLKQAGRLDYVVAMVGARVIDRVGIVPAVATAMDRALKRLEQNDSDNGPENDPVNYVDNNPAYNPETTPTIPVNWNSTIYRTKPKSKAAGPRTNSNKWMIKLDGALRAPERFTSQETIIKGDLLEPAIGLASIMAKVTRDRYMTKLSLCKGSPYTKYNFHIHKGYGTKMHRELIARHGLSPIHRTSYCKNIEVL